mmetsp:Transcript_3429/g.13853  ORF Transcript_3429/g.13853 Transcript_3429/m.13853 type:complete len:208 (+) Transcript_3429:1018-1641(+)
MECCALASVARARSDAMEDVTEETSASVVDQRDIRPLAAVYTAGKSAASCDASAAASFTCTVTAAVASSRRCACRASALSSSGCFASAAAYWRLKYSRSMRFLCTLSSFGFRALCFRSQSCRGLVTSPSTATSNCFRQVCNFLTCGSSLPRPLGGRRTFTVVSTGEPGGLSGRPASTASDFTASVIALPSRPPSAAADPATACSTFL